MWATKRHYGLTNECAPICKGLSGANVANLAPEGQHFLQEDRCFSAQSTDVFWPKFQNKSFLQSTVWTQRLFLTEDSKAKNNCFLCAHLVGTLKDKTLNNNRQEKSLQAKMKLWESWEHLFERTHAGSSSDNVTEIVLHLQAALASITCLWHYSQWPWEVISCRRHRLGYHYWITQAKALRQMVSFMC